MAVDREHRQQLEAHRGWINALQPTGVVVVAPALLEGQAVLPENVAETQRRLKAVVDDLETHPRLSSLPDLLTEVLGWQPEDIFGLPGGPPVPESLHVALPDLDDVLFPTYAIADPFVTEDLDLDGEDEKGSHEKWLLLIEEVPTGTDIDALPPERNDGWRATPHVRFERLLREAKVPVGLLVNGELVRLVYAPRGGESSGWMSFPVSEMVAPMGRDLLGAFEMLLGEHRVWSAPDDRRLHALLRASRRFQNEVSAELAEQVLDALWQLLRGFQAADALAGGRVLGEPCVPRDRPQEIYGGLLTVVMRLVFLLYAEDRDLLPQETFWRENYSLHGLWDRLRRDAALYPDNLHQRHGAWPWLLTVFRLMHEGGSHGAMRLPPRRGRLFDPDLYPFLECRAFGTRRVKGERILPPRVADGVVYEVLKRLLVLDGERLSYRSLDVQQIGSVYEAMMGFTVEWMAGHSVGVRADSHKSGSVRADLVIDLDRLLEEPPKEREKWLGEHGDCKLKGKAAKALRAAETPADVAAALGRRLSLHTPRPLPPGSRVLQPNEERRRSGTHYTPRELTQPIVETTLRPVLEALGERPRPEQILSLKILDPAMGSGAFLVEACRQLARHLDEAWQTHDAVPEIPPDEEPELHALRLVAQRCLYGVDRNPFAVDLAKLSLWLATLARDHPFTFLDHALRHGDSLVGLDREQITYLRWTRPKDDELPLFDPLEVGVAVARSKREEIHALGDDGYQMKNQLHLEAEEALVDARLLGDAVIAAFFSATKASARHDARETLRHRTGLWLEARNAGRDAEAREQRAALQADVDDLRLERQVTPFHWSVEFPEVFDRPTSGFDAVIGNPPFAGKNTIAAGHVDGFPAWLKMLHEKSHGNSDLVAHFFRRAFNLLRPGGAFGLLATNTIAQGDTRTTGLEWLCTHGGTIFAATKRRSWPGAAAVVVSEVHVYRGDLSGPCVLDGREVDLITAFLFDAGDHHSPQPLAANSGKCFQGSVILGMGFTFDDQDSKGVASSIAVMDRLIKKDQKNSELIRPLIGYSEVANDPEHCPHRYVIDFGEMTLKEASGWPDLLAVVEQRVRPFRERKRRTSIDRKRADLWWQFGSPAKNLYRTINRAKLSRVIVTASQASEHFAFALVSSEMVYTSNLNVFPFETASAFACLQSRVHEVWARFFGSSLEDRFSYTPTTCLEPYPFLVDWASNPHMEAAGSEYLSYRAQTMRTRQVGLTEMYNAFHDPERLGSEIVALRRLHDAVDRAVLDAYGWRDIPTDCEFLLDYEIDEENWSPRKKKPYRYRWPDEVRDRVLRRLIQLHQKRLVEEGSAARAMAKKSRQQTRERRKRSTAAEKSAPATTQNLSLDLGEPD